MKIVKQSAVLLASTPGAERLIETAGRVCYASGEARDPAKFVRMLIARGHESVLEHASATVSLVLDRAIAGELNRHRFFSPSQSSTRYIRQDDGIEVVKPEFEHAGSDEIWQEACEHAEGAYLALLANGERPELARSVLVQCLAARLAGTANLREWRHILRLRLAKEAHPQMRELARLMLAELRPVAPSAFEEFGA